MALCSYGCGWEATTRDHTTPKAHGGRDKVPCCQPCNQLKADMPYAKWQAWCGTDGWREAREDLIGRWDRDGWPTNQRDDTGRRRRRKRNARRRKAHERAPRPQRDVWRGVCPRCGHDVTRRCPPGCMCL